MARYPSSVDAPRPFYLGYMLKQFFGAPAFSGCASSGAAASGCFVLTQKRLARRQKETPALSAPPHVPLRRFLRPATLLSRAAALGLCGRQGFPLSCSPFPLPSFFLPKSTARKTEKNAGPAGQGRSLKVFPLSLASAGPRLLHPALDFHPL